MHWSHSIILQILRKILSDCCIVNLCIMHRCYLISNFRAVNNKIIYSFPVGCTCYLFVSLHTEVPLGTEPPPPPHRPHWRKASLKINNEGLLRLYRSMGEMLSSLSCCGIVELCREISYKFKQLSA